MSAPSVVVQENRHGQHQHGFAEHLLRALRMVLVLTALTQMLHALHLPTLAQFDHLFTSKVLQRLLTPEKQDERRPVPQDMQTVQLLEIDAALRVKALEARYSAADTVKRLDGANAIGRQAMAELLSLLADCLGDEQCTPEATRPRALAIDVDLAPLTGNDGADEMIAALHRLRQYVDVVVIALGREDRDEQLQRNAFMRSALCSRVVPDARRRAGLRGQPSHGLYFASARLLQLSQQGPLGFLHQKSKLRTSTDAKFLPDLFPALGQLAYTAVSLTAGTPAADHAKKQQSEEALTIYCRQAEANEPLLGEDPDEDAKFVGEATIKLAGKYNSWYFNWPLLYSDALHFTPLDRGDEDNPWQAQLREQLRQQRLQAPILLLNIEGGAGNDRFFTPAALPEPVSGGTLHALQALSLHSRLAGSGWKGGLADLLLGAGLALASALVHSVVAVLLQPRLPGLARLALVCSSLTLACVFSCAGLRLGVYMMGWNEPVWFNPLYVLIGMALHAMLEGWSASSTADSMVQHWPKRSLLVRVFFEAAPPLYPRFDAKFRLWGYWLLVALGVAATIWNTNH